MLDNRITTTDMSKYVQVYLDHKLIFNIHKIKDAKSNTTMGYRTNNGLDFIELEDAVASGLYMALSAIPDSNLDLKEIKIVELKPQHFPFAMSDSITVNPHSFKSTLDNQVGAYCVNGIDKYQVHNNSKWYVIYCDYHSEKIFLLPPYSRIEYKLRSKE